MECMVLQSAYDGEEKVLVNAEKVVAMVEEPHEEYGGVTRIFMEGNENVRLRVMESIEEIQQKSRGG